MADTAGFDFALRLYQQVVKEEVGKNVFISPYSISAAFSMVLLGAMGNTAIEIVKGLGFSVDDTGEIAQTGQTQQVAQKSDFQKVVHTRQQELLRQLSKSLKNITLETANKLFVEQNFRLTSEFLEDSSKFYQTEAESLDFQKDSENSRLHINKWIEDKTRRKIQNLLPSGSIDPLTRLVIANAIYFKGDWLNKFDQKNTRLADFFVDEEKVAKVQMMSQEKKFKIGFDRELGVQVVNLPYKGESISMILLVPTERFGLKALESKLSHEKLLSLTSQFSLEKAVLSLPKMKLEFDLDLVPILIKLGINDVFGDNADLSRISGQQGLYVSGAFHKAFLEVNEEGSEAAAATAVVIALRSMPAMPVRITCDHPFLFLIKHNPTQSILFMGRFVSP